MSSRSIGAALCVAFIACLTNPAVATAREAQLAGCVTRPDGSPVLDATVSARGATNDVTTTDTRGCFTLRSQTGTYVVRVEATGFEPFVRAGIRADARLDVTLAPASSSLVTIGRVDVDGRGSVSTSSAPSVTLDARRAAQFGFTSVSEMLASALSLTAIRPAGGGANAPRVFALRGPDPSETLVDIDGHEMNDGNTGDFDLSLLDPADLSSVELVYGVAPSSLVGPNTIGGAINLRTLEPTERPHGLLRVSGGTYDSFGTTLQSTGTSGRLGYALSLHRLTTDNEIHERAIAYAAAVPSGLATASVGSGATSSSLLAKTRYTLGSHPGDGYVELRVRNQATLRDESAALSSLQPGGTFNSFAGSFVASHNAGYDLDARIPAGRRDAFGNAAASITFRHQSSTANQSVFGPAADASSAYFYNDRDAIGDDTIEFDRSGSSTSFAIKAAVRTERLTQPFSVAALAGQTDRSVTHRSVAPFAAARDASSVEAAPVASDVPVLDSLAQTQRSFVIRYAFDAAPRVHATLATYYSNFTTFGTSLDPRTGLVWTPNARTAVRGSVGTTFQSPALSELFVPNPLPDATATLVHIGNPHLRADHATEYDVGADQLIGGNRMPLHLSADVYRTNLRNPAQTLIPASGTGYSFPVNVGAAVYRGFEIRAERDVVPRTRLRLGYSRSEAYPASVPSDVGGASLVPGKQFLGVPLERGTFALERSAARGLSYSVGGLFEGRNNELNEPAFVTLRGSIGYAFDRYRIDVTGQNLTNVYAFGFTRAGAGVPYAGTDGPIPLDAYALPAGSVTISVSRHF